MESPFHYVRLTTFCYTTEIRDRVRAALSFIAYGDTNDDEIEEETIKGQFGDDIIVMHIRLERSRDIRALSRRMLPLLSPDDVEAKVDEKWFFHLRFDKEAAFHGNLDITEGTNVVTLKGKIQVYPASRERAVVCLREYVANNN